MTLTALRRLLLTALVVFPCAGVCAAEPYLARTRAHIKCKFADGSYIEYKEREKWYFKTGLHPHAQTVAPLDSQLGYVDAEGRRHDDIGTSELDCLGSGKRDGRVFWRNGFEDTKNRMIKFVFPPAKPDQIAIDTLPSPSEAPHLRDRLAELKSHEFVHSLRTAMVVPLDERQLLLEEPLTTLRHPDYPTNTVLYVLQSMSRDFGRTWTEPVVTNDAKLYEIGRTLKEQSWAPQLEVIVLDSSMRPAR